MTVRTRGIRVAAVLSIVALAAAFSVRARTRKTDAWPQGLQVTTAASVVDQIRASDAPVLVVIFAGWCDECRREIPALDRALAAFAAGPPRVVAVTVDEEPDGYQPLAAPRVSFRPARLTFGEQDLLVEAVRSLGGTYHRSIPYVALFDHRGATVRDHWTPGRRVEEITKALSELNTTAGAAGDTR
jgi:thiol-disulfide isomerase/thioredoxin